MLCFDYTLSYQTLTIVLLCRLWKPPSTIVPELGNADVLLEVVKHIGPARVQVAVNKQAKVCCPIAYHTKAVSKTFILSKVEKKDRDTH